MQHIRQTIDKEFHKIYKETEKLAEKLPVKPTVPRSAINKMHRNSFPAENPEECYWRAPVILLAHQFITEMTSRFNSFRKTASNLLLLVPSSIERLLEQYSGDFPNPDDIGLELKLWKRKWSKIQKENRPASLTKAIKHCDKLKFQIVFTLIKIGCTLAVTSAECVRSFSAMRRLRTWLRSTMKSDCLSSVAEYT